jgi:iron complex outermembrane receptor protein
MKKNIQFHYTVLLALLLQATAAAGDEAYQDLTSIPIEQLVQMEVVTASRLARQVSDAPSAVAVVTAQDIKDYGYRTLADILNSMRGLYTTNDHAFDYLGGRGFSRPGDYAGRILLLIDGYAANDNIYNQIYLDHSGLLDTELIERVEYIPGTGSVLYGNNAYFGIISVTTKKGRDIGGTQAAVDAFSHGGRKARATFGQQLENGADVLLSASSLKSDGQNWYFPEFDTPATNHGVAENLDYQHSNRLFGKLHYENWTIEGGYVDERKAVPTGGGGLQFNAYQLFREANGFLSANYDTNLGAGLRSSTHAYAGLYMDRGIYTFDALSLLPGTFREFNRGQWWGIDQKFAYTGIAGQKLVFGAEYRDDFRFSLSNPTDTSEHDRQTISLYAQDEITLNRQWLLNVGARYDHGSDVGGNLSPRVALIWSPTSRTTIKAAYSTAFRMPAAYEKYYVNNNNGQIANPDLQPETVTTAELVVRHEFAPDFSLTGSLYRYRTQDLIDSVTQPSGFDQFVNVGSSHTKGLELELERLWQDRVRLRTSYAYQDAENWQGTKAVNAPKHLGKLNLSLPIYGPQVRSGFEMQYVGARLTESGRNLGSYTLANLTVTADLPHGLSASATLRNLLDKHYLAVTSGLTQDVLEMDGRSFWLNLTYDFR